MASPVADLSYRHYDGPINPPSHRWWAIARASMRLSVKKRFFYLWASMSGYLYVLLLAVFYFLGLGNAALPAGEKNPILQGIVWKDQFLNAFSCGQLFFFILTLILGIGAIANDNRANALLVYLSKPCTRFDYVFGKWLGIFIPLTIITAIPTVTFYLYCLMTYRDYGFLTEDPRLPLKLLGMILIPGVVHASLALGISSMFRQGRMAGATYAGIYFFTNIFTVIIGGIVNHQQSNGGSVSGALNKLFYCSIDGLQIGLAKAILGTDGSALFPGMSGGGRRGGGGGLPIPAPEPWLIFGFTGLLCAVSLVIAWTRVRAVEVVG